MDAAGSLASARGALQKHILEQRAANGCLLGVAHPQLCPLGGLGIGGSLDNEGSSGGGRSPKQALGVFVQCEHMGQPDQTAVAGRVTRPGAVGPTPVSTASAVRGGLLRALHFSDQLIFHTQAVGPHYFVECAIGPQGPHFIPRCLTMMDSGPLSSNCSGTPGHSPSSAMFMCAKRRMVTMLLRSV